MGYFFAEFDFCKGSQCMVRKHTRVYYHFQNPPPSSRKGGKCVGVVWMCNPGSAVRPSQPVPWGVIAPDPTLRAVRRLYEQAVLAKDGAYLPGTEDYLLVLNCYYSVDQNHALAYAEWRQSKCRYKERIPKGAKFVVAAWGADKPDSLVFQAMKKIIQSEKKGSVELVVYVDPPLLPKGPSRLGKNLKAMTYPAHPLNPHFASHVPAMATLMAPFV